MQQILDDWIKNNPSDTGYFTIVQHDDGPLLRLPENTIVYGCCSGNIPIPLIYEDLSNKLDNEIKVNFNDKKILCSFVGTLTNSVRYEIVNNFYNNSNFFFNVSQSWSPVVEKNKQDNFINITKYSKFALAPRGYGRSSFRFYEIFKLGTIPIYVWNDTEWLPYKDILDYSKFCISINIKDIVNLESILLGIDEKKYNSMLSEYNKIKHFFDLNSMYEYIMNQTF